MRKSEGKAKDRTRQKRGLHRRVEEMLARLANRSGYLGTLEVGTVIVENVSSLQKFKKLHPNVAVTMRTEDLANFQKDYPGVFDDFSKGDLGALQSLLRQAWSAEPRSREWFCFFIRQFGTEVSRLKRQFDSDGGQSLLAAWERDKQTIDTGLKFGRFSPAQMLFSWRDGELIDAARKATPPELTPFEQVFLHLQRNLHRAMVCKNPECPAKYFFRVKVGQLFCSIACYSQVKRARDRTWWRENRGKGRRRRGN